MSIYKNLSIGKKTILGFGALLAVFLIAIGTILVESFALRTTMETVKHETEMLNLAKDVEIHVLGVMTYFGEVAASTDEASLKEAVAAIDLHREAYGKEMARLNSKVQNPETRALIAAVSDSVAALRSPNDRLLEHAREGRHADAARVFAKESIPGILAWQKCCAALTGGLQQKFDQATDSAEGAIRTELATITLAAGVATLVSILLGVLLARSITRPIHAFMGALKTFSEADFTVKVQVESRSLSKLQVRVPPRRPIRSRSVAFATAVSGRKQPLLANVFHLLEWVESDLFFVKVWLICTIRKV